MADADRTKIDSFLFHIQRGEVSAAMQNEAALESVIRPTRGGGRDDDFVFSAANKSTPTPPRMRDIPDDVRRAAEAFQNAPPPDLPDLETPLDERPSYAGGIPVILQTRNSGWTGADVPGFRPGSMLGSVMSGHVVGGQETFDMLAADPEILRVDISRDAGAPELDISIPATGGDAVHVPPMAERGANCLVAVIDGGLDVLHEAFRDAAGNTRIAAYWDQWDQTGPPPRKADGTPLHGTLHTAADIDGYIAAGAVPARMRRDPYIRFGVNVGGHGTHVTSIAAGRAVGDFAGGMAPEARIVFVRPKTRTGAGDPVSVGYSAAHVEALAFIGRIAEQEDLPVVVNMSFGLNAGAHDGSSLLEAAFDEFTGGGRIPGRALVKSAGNAASDGLHAVFRTGEEQLTTLNWVARSVVAPHRRDHLIELWFDASSDLTFVLVDPDSNESFAVNRQSPTDSDTFPNGNDYSMTLDHMHRDNGDSRVLIRIGAGGAQEVAAGIWALDVHGDRVRTDGTVDAWIERDDAKPLGFVSDAADEGTLSIPGTAHSVLCVAAVDRQMRGRVMSFSSRGATRDGRPRPDIGAPGDAIVAARSGTASGVTAQSGTSMAAPHVAGAIALLLSHRHGRVGVEQYNMNQIRAALRQSSRGFNGHWNETRGWGMLDTAALLDLA